jgi:trimethylguanosine synthase
MDISPTRLALARHNAAIYGVADRIEFIQADYLSFARSHLSSTSRRSQAYPRKIDVVFLSPPWGGPEYISGDAHGTSAGDTRLLGQNHPEFSLAGIRPIHGAALFRLTRKITQNVAYFLPRNTNLQEIADLLIEGEEEGKEEDADEKGKHKVVQQEIVEVEEEWMGTKLKALTCYFGGLASGQEELYDPPA